MRRMPSAAYRPETEGHPRNPGPPSRAAHHGCGLSRDVTTKSVRSLPHLEQRNLRRVSGTSPLPWSMRACRSASAWCWQPPLHQTSSQT